jgi:hypothetical protein
VLAREFWRGGRKVSQTKVKEEFGQGRMFGAKEAVTRGMADRIATLEQVTAAMITKILSRGAMTRRRSALVFD